MMVCDRILPANFVSILWRRVYYKSLNAEICRFFSSRLPSVGGAETEEGRSERLRTAYGSIRRQLALQERLPDARQDAAGEL